MPITINHVLTATTPDNTSYEIRPSHWNSLHALTLNLSGTDISNAFGTSGNVTFGTDALGNISASAAGGGVTTLAVFGGSNTTGASSSSTYPLSALTFAGEGIISIGQSNGSVQFSAPGSAILSQLSAGVSTGGNSYGTTGLVAQGQMVFFGGTNISLSQSINGSSATLSVIAPPISSISGSNGISISTNGSTIYVSEINPQWNAYNNTTGQSTSSTFNATLLSLYGAGNVSVGWSGSSLVISGGTAANAPVNFSAGANSGNLGSVVFSNSNGVSFGLNGSTITASAAGGAGGGFNISGGAGTSNSAVSGITFSNSNGMTFGVSTGASVVTVTASYTVPTSYVSNINGSSGALSLAVGSSLSSSTNGSSITFGLASNITTALQSTGNYLTTAAQSSASNVSAIYAATNNTGGGTATLSGGVSFSAANGLTFYTSAGNAIAASYTVPTQTVQSLGLYASSQTTGSATSYTFDARSLSIIGAGIVSIGMNSTSAGGTTTGLLISATQSNQAVSAQGGSSAFQTLIFTNSNNVSFSNTGGSIWGSYALNVSAAGGTSNALSGLTFSNLNGVSFGLSTGAGVGTLTASVAAAGVTTGGVYLQGNTSNASSTTMNLSSYNLSGLGAITLAASASSIQIQVPATSSLSGANGISVSSNGSTISVSYSNVEYTYVPQWPQSTNSLLLAALGATSANPVFFPFQIDEYVGFNVIGMLESHSFVTSSSAASLTQQVQFGLFSNNASTWSLISSGSSSLGLTNSGISGTLSYATATGTGGYTYSTLPWSSTATAESLFGNYGYRVAGMQFGGMMSLSPGWYAIGLLSTNKSSSANVGINQALIGNVVSVSSYFPMGQSTTVTNNMLGMGYGTASTASLPSSMPFSNMTNSLPIIPLITLQST